MYVMFYFFKILLKNKTLPLINENDGFIDRNHRR